MNNIFHHSHREHPEICKIANINIQLFQLNYANVLHSLSKTFSASVELSIQFELATLIKRNIARNIQATVE